MKRGHYHPGHCTTCDRPLDGTVRGHACGACGREFCAEHIKAHMDVVHRARQRRRKG